MIGGAVSFEIEATHAAAEPRVTMTWTTHVILDHEQVFGVDGSKVSGCDARSDVVAEQSLVGEGVLFERGAAECDSDGASVFEMIWQQVDFAKP